MSNATWDELQMRTYNAIRAIDEDRIIFLSPNAYNDPSTFDAMTLPYDDDAVAIDVHDYTPHEFTHQGYDGRATGIAYTHKVYEQFIAQIDKTVENRQSTGLPHIIGEFGVIKNAVVVDAVAFLCDVTTCMEQHDFAWTMWEFGGLKDAYFSFDGWHEVLMEAIMTDEYLKYYK